MLAENQYVQTVKEAVYPYTSKYYFTKLLYHFHRTAHFPWCVNVKIFPEHRQPNKQPPSPSTTLQLDNHRCNVQRSCFHVERKFGTRVIPGGFALLTGEIVDRKTEVS